MAETSDKSIPQPNSALPAYMFKDPVLTFFTLPILPFILFIQSINMGWNKTFTKRRNT